ncbi:hypothetical protein GIB67_022938 [Kingdonia uniflora]|uniref:Uncharacterized protein n=1 Tax=Kingdonia uniflora TaxID=39325 RepID=A0A7J7P2A2_9MAGN|nr:hypothetical protein GIB67_022938 [Kingdonia uniflora]
MGFRRGQMVAVGNNESVDFAGPWYTAKIILLPSESSSSKSLSWSKFPSRSAAFSPSALSRKRIPSQDGRQKRLSWRIFPELHGRTQRPIQRTSEAIDDMMEVIRNLRRSVSTLKFSICNNMLTTTSCLPALAELASLAPTATKLTVNTPIVVSSKPAAVSPEKFTERSVLGWQKLQSKGTDFSELNGHQTGKDVCVPSEEHLKLRKEGNIPNDRTIDMKKVDRVIDPFSFPKKSTLKTPKRAREQIKMASPKRGKLNALSKDITTPTQGT